MVDTGALFTGAVGTAAWGVAAYQAARQWQAGAGRRTSGMITRISAAGRGGSSCTVQFMDESGTPRRFETNVRGQVGETVRVGYPAGKPQRARRVGGLAPWGLPIMATAVGGVFLWVSASLLGSGGLPHVLSGR
ncbi:DUF3592 domain-containing protein [Streptomyces sp. 1331.2]|uniref:DUF3592 domain-containing protein n=1 Tax=Streptomyces sp. 1331.2 TaxID=1938835 RepID=UPI000BD38E1C|nr:DUF3592 domain-containing protein [Streptomyces sp. 1331.2]SOB88748.1 hypothetical protein SAMN06272789_7048 [Streptomyces sp. 1331.2]